MLDIPLFADIIIILGLAIAVSYICNRLKIPSIVGFLITGIIAGPSGFALINAVHEVEVMAEIGVVLLLFSIGLEFSLQYLIRIKKAVFLGGATQVLSSIIITYLILTYFKIPVNQAILIGFLIALSSTAIVLNQLQSNAQMNTPHGNTTLGILLFQDVIIVPMMIIVPFLSGQASFDLISILLLILKIAGLFIFIFIGAKWIVPFVFYSIAKTRNRELFLLSIIFVAFAIAFLTHEIGLSLALGAFLAGLMISESEYSHDAIALILPFRSIFMSFFFVSIGMLLNLSSLILHWEYIGVLILAIFSLKLITSGIATLLLGYPLRTILLVGLALAQIGEFSFILAKESQKYNLMLENNYQIFLAVSVITMIATPFLISSGTFVDKLVRFLPAPRKLKEKKAKAASEVFNLQDHLIIIGFGINGQNLAYAARAAHIDYNILDLNPETVRKRKKLGEPIHFGDSTYPEVLKALNIESAKVIAIAIPDQAAIRQTVVNARSLNPDIHIITRSRFASDIETLGKSGANEIISEELESAIGIFNRVLKKFNVSEEQLSALNLKVRSKNYKEIRADQWSCKDIDDLNVAD